MKKIILLLTLILELGLSAQSPEFNLQKYWFYRQRFKQFFVSIGTAPGQSLAVAMMKINDESSLNILKS